jgi:hypothetical protein
MEITRLHADSIENLTDDPPKKSLRKAIPPR